jgi:hypothetical protein
LPLSVCRAQRTEIQLLQKKVTASPEGSPLVKLRNSA